MKVLYINSFPRSGSTLLGSLLGRHPEVRYLGEVRNLYPPNANSAFQTDEFKNSDFWCEVNNSVINHGSNNLVTKTGDGSHETTCFKNIRLIYGICDAAAAERWIVDSSHRTREAKNHSKVLGDDIKVVFLTRDGRAVLNSILKRTNNESFKITSIRFLFKWIRFNIGAFLFRRSTKPQNHIHIRYEDLCENPIGTLNQLSEFISVSPFEKGYFDSEYEYVFIGGSSTFAGVDEGFSNLNEDLSWKTQLPPTAKMLFGVIGSRMNKYLGY